MSCYKKIVIFLFFILISTSNAKDISIENYFNEDLHILYALENERNANFEESKKLYFELFEKTNKYQYLVKYLKISLSTKNFQDVKNIASENLNKDVKEYEVILRIYCVSLLNLKENDESLKVAKQLVSEFESALNYEVLANVYFVNKSYEKALSYFEISYSIDKNSHTLFNLVNLQYAYLNKKKEALAYLETHVRLYGCDYVVCSKLLSIYQEQNNIIGAISILKRMYINAKNNENNELADKAYKLLISYLEKKDLNEAIDFLEEYDLDKIKLLSLYRRTNKIKKALDLVKNLYEKDGNIDLLAQIAILEFESAKDKRKVLQSVIKKFDDVLTVLDSHVYQNYVGYILIDYDVDIKKGLKLVNKALEKAPNNVAYLDSLAWGEYKLNNCKEASLAIQKVVDQVGLIDEEIKLHWKKIKECVK